VIDTNYIALHQFKIFVIIFEFNYVEAIIGNDLWLRTTDTSTPINMHPRVIERTRAAQVSIIKKSTDLPK
jgi:hypothetical protein